MTMAEGARITSSEAIGLFRARLAVYLSKAKPLLDGATEEYVRTREWIRTDRRLHWESEARRRKRQLENAEQALFSARFSNLREVTAAEQAAVHRAKAALEEAEEKLRQVKRWSLDFDEKAGPLAKQIEQLRTMVSGDLARALLYLDGVIKAVEAYAETRPAGLSGAGEAARAEVIEPAVKAAAEPSAEPAAEAATKEGA